MAAGLLLDRSWSAGQRPGARPGRLLPDNMAQVITEALRRPVRFQEVPGDAYQATMLQYGMT